MAEYKPPLRPPVDPDWFPALCDMRGCIQPAFVRVDGIAHCWPHFEIAWERWEIPPGSPIREHFDDMTPRQDKTHQELMAAQARKHAEKKRLEKWESRQRK